MSLDETISPNEVKEWLTQVLQYYVFRTEPRLVNLLKYLVEAELAHKSVTQDDILEHVFKGGSDPSYVSHQTKKLREQLEKYYTEDGAKDDVIFECERRKCRVTFKRKQGVVAARLRRIEERFKGKEVECYHVGNVQAGIEFVIEQMPYLAALRDTHVRPKEGYDKFKPETLNEFRQSLADFLSRSSENRLYLIVGYGQMVDEKYLQIFSDIPKSQKDQARCRKLRYPGSFLNFIILDYVDDRLFPKTVLFGWGRLGDEPQEAVFLSRDKRLVSEFEELYAALNSFVFSDEVSDLAEFSTISESPILPLGQYDTLKVFKSVETSPIYRDIENCKYIRLITTGISEMEKWKPLKSALGKGARVEILFSHPECSFFKQRLLLLQRDLEFAKRNRRTFLQELVGNVEIRVTRQPLSNSYIQLDDLIYFGLFWNDYSIFHGPIFSTRKASDTGIFLANRSQELWDDGSNYDDLDDDLR